VLDLLNKNPLMKIIYLFIAVIMLVSSGYIAYNYSNETEGDEIEIDIITYKCINDQDLYKAFSWWLKSEEGLVLYPTKDTDWYMIGWSQNIFSDEELSYWNNIAPITVQQANELFLYNLENIYYPAVIDRYGFDHPKAVLYGLTELHYHKGQNWYNEDLYRAVKSKDYKKASIIVKSLPDPYDRRNKTSKWISCDYKYIYENMRSDSLTVIKILRNASKRQD